MSKSNIVSAEQFRAAFRLDPNPWPSASAERALVQLGLPSPTAISLWLAPERGGRLEPKVVLRDPSSSQARFIPLGSTGIVRVNLDGLSPGRAYEVDVQTSPSAPLQTLRASTAPSASTPDFSFLASSCFAPYAPRGHFGAFVEGGFRPQAADTSQRAQVTRRTAHILRLLRQRATSANPPAFLLGLGDQIYVDSGESAGLSLLDGSDDKRYEPSDASDVFETIYRATFSLEPYAAALQALPSAMIWDDHEIRDGWGSQGDEESEDWRPHLQAARDHFVAWQASRNPARGAGPALDAAGYAQAARVGSELTRNPELDFGFDWGSAATFFVMDLRSCRNAYAKEARVVSQEQLDRLEAWFASRDHTPTLWVLGSPLPLGHDERGFDRFQRWFIRSRRDDMLDAWWSKPLRRQREQVFAIIQRHFERQRSHRLLVLSGDVHFSEVLELSDQRGRVFGHEIVSSGLAQTYFKRLRGKTPQRTELPCGLSSIGLGRLHAPSFAEVHVQPPQPGQAPGVEVTFHTSVDQTGKYLANVTEPSRSRIELALTPSAHKYGRGAELFEPFIVRDPRQRPALDLATAEDEGLTT